jgi:hypothetical protein
MPKYRTNKSRLHSVLRYCMGRLAAAYMAGTGAQVDRWLAAVEQARRRINATALA